MKILENKKMTAGIAGTLAACMITGLLVNGTFKADVASVPETKTLASSGDADELKGILEGSIKTNTNTDVDKEETVYVIADANGKSEEVIVSDWLKNKKKESEIKDETSLTGIENVKGDEKFDQSGNSLTWNAGGDEIYYKGSTEKALPVGVNISYKLNGKEVTADEIAGADGLVTVHVDYKNTTASNEYVPFMMITGMILDGENFSSVTASNGEVISDGNRYIVIGMGMPGVKDALGLTDTELDIDIPDSFEVNADAKDFSLGMTMTVATSKMWNRISSDADVDEVADYIEDLSDDFSGGMEALKDGISEYTKGVSKVAEGAGDLESGAKKLADGGSSLKDGASKAAEGTDALEKGIYQISTGADELRTIGNTKLVIGANQLSSGVSTLNEEVQKLSLDGLEVKDRELSPEEKAAAANKIAERGAAYAEANGAGVDSNELTAKMMNGLATDETSIKNEAAAAGASAGQSAGTGYADTAKAEAFKIVKDIYGAEFDENNSAQQQAIVSIAGALASAYGNGYGNGYGTGYGTAYGKVMTQIKTNSNDVSVYLTNGITKLCQSYGMAGADVGKEMTMAAVKTEVDAVKEEYQPKIDTLKTSVALLDTKTAELASGIRTYNSGVATLADSLNTVSTKTTELSNGLDTLAKGAGDLSSGTEQLKNGASKLSTGTATLDSNSAALNDGADKLSDATEKVSDKLKDSGKDMKDIAENIDKVSEAGRNYQTFAGKSDKMTGTVKFIIRTDAVEKSAE